METDRIGLSIVIPSFNPGEYLIEMIESIRSQTSNCWEMIIVDDGSTDGTPDKISARYSGDPRIKLIRRERLPKGGDTCRNIGFENARGKYVSFLDSDDLVTPTFVEHRVGFMEKNPDIDFAVFPAKCFASDGELPQILKDRRYGKDTKDKDVLSLFLRNEYPYTIWTNIYRRSAISDIRWDEDVYVYQDLDFNIQVLLKGLKLKYADLEEPDYLYRVGISGSVCSNFINQNKCRSTVHLFDKISQSLINKNIYEKYKDDFFIFFLRHYQRLLNGATKDDIAKFEALIAKYYRKSKRLKFISSVVPKIKNEKINTIALYSLYALLLGESYYFKKLVNRLH